MTVVGETEHGLRVELEIDGESVAIHQEMSSNFVVVSKRDVLTIAAMLTGKNFCFVTQKELDRMVPKEEMAQAVQERADNLTRNYKMSAKIARDDRDEWIQRAMRSHGGEDVGGRKSLEIIAWMLRSEGCGCCAGDDSGEARIAAKKMLEEYGVDE